MTPPRPISYDALTKGTPVLDSAGAAFGNVEHVLQIPELDVFDGIVVTTPHGLRFLDRDQVTEITESEVRSSILPNEVNKLPKPVEGAPSFHANPDQDEGPSLTAHFGRLFRREHWVQDRN